MFEKLANLIRGERAGSSTGSPDPQPGDGDGSREPYLIVGLGNPGREYRTTRHNVGFMAVDALAKTFDTALTRMQSNALIGQIAVGGRKVVLAKPQTYMNLSGQAVASLVRFYKVPLDHLLVVHDELDLPYGTIRLRPGGGSAGARGMGSIIDRLGTHEFPRLRIGIGRPAGRMDPADYVLQEFSRVEQEMLPPVLDRAGAAARTFLEQGIQQAMNQFNGPLEKE
jgi:PTH1 family peptidyl-tRNA hydrolase